MTPEGCRLQRADDITLRDAGHLAVDGHTDTDTDTDRQTPEVSIVIKNKPLGNYVKSADPLLIATSSILICN